MYVQIAEAARAEHFATGAGGCMTGAGRRRAAPAADRPLVLLVSPEDVARELRCEASPYYFGACGTDAATGIDRGLRDAVRCAAHPVDLLRRLGEWADQVQAATPTGRLAACWHPVLTPEVLRQASRYPVHVVHARTAAEALAGGTAVLAQSPVAATP